MRAACIVLALAVLTAPAAAQSDLPPEVAKPEKVPGERSPGKAMILSAVLPALSVAVGSTMMAEGGAWFEAGTFVTFAGGVVLPASGLWYGGNKGGVGILARSGAAAIVAYGGRLAYTNHWDCNESQNECDLETQEDKDERRKRGQNLMYAGAALWMLSAINDVRNAEKVTRAWNADRSLRARGMRPPALAPGRKPRSPEAAMALTLIVPAATLAWGKVMLTAEDLRPLGWVTIAYGVVAAPSTGVWYAGNGGGKGMTVRSLIGIAMAIGYSKAFDDDFECFDPSCREERDEERREGRYILGVSSALWMTSVLYDMRASARATGRWNEKRGMHLAPTIWHTPSGRAPGFTLSTTW